MQLEQLLANLSQGMDGLFASLQHQQAAATLSQAASPSATSLTQRRAAERSRATPRSQPSSTLNPSTAHNHSPNPNPNQCKPLDLSVKQARGRRQADKLPRPAPAEPLQAGDPLGGGQSARLLVDSTSPFCYAHLRVSPAESCASRSSSSSGSRTQPDEEPAPSGRPAHCDVISSSARRGEPPAGAAPPPHARAKEAKTKGAKSHLCRHCGRTFSRSDMLTRHSRLHSGLKPYQCAKCRQVFSRSDHLSTHERTHTGEKPYRCQHCEYSACRRDMITRHMRTHVAHAPAGQRRQSSSQSPPVSTTAPAGLCRP